MSDHCEKEDCHCQPIRDQRDAAERREKETRRILRHAVHLLKLVKPQVADWNEGDDADLEWFDEESK